MTVNSSHPNLKISKKQKGFPYYEEMLNLFWATVKRPSTYEYNITHGFNCSCCGRQVPEDSNSKGELIRKKERRYY